MYTEVITEEHITIPMASPHEVSVVSESRRYAARAAVLMGFSTDPVARWMYPDAAEYFGHFPTFIRGLAGKSFEAGSANATDDNSGAALWLPPGVESDEEVLTNLILQTTEGQIQSDLFGLIEQMGANHPNEPHWYLPMIGVDTRMQNRGVGSALMRYSLERCDRDGLPAYLESSNPRNISLYRRFGFEVTGEIQAGSSPTMYPMVRRPAKALSATAN